jgi:hypothetical protein
MESVPKFKKEEFIMFLYESFTDKYGNDTSELKNHIFGTIPLQN